MTPERHKRIGQLYRAVLALEPAERTAYLAEACAGDDELRREVVSLLGLQAQAEGFLEKPAWEFAARSLVSEPLRVRIGQRLAHYEVLALLGAGGMGEVYLAQDTKLERRVAVKLLPAEFTTDAERVRRFIQEAKAASALSHPHIVTIHEIGEAEAGHFIVMELVQGQTLRKLSKPSALDLLANLGAQIARALDATHAAGITHRDIKPENIMVRDDGYVKVLDFGLARLAPLVTSASEAATFAQHTMPGAILGTCAYMSPEQALGKAITPATDIFALGLVFYELATGQHPFKAESMIGVLHSITSEPPLLPSRLNPAIPPSLDDLIGKMLEKDAGWRPAAAEVVRALAGLSSGITVSDVQRGIKPAIVRHTVGRERERAELRAGFESALSGRGLLLGVAGEPGIGKTTLVEDFLTELAAEGRCTIARGRCSERLAGTEAYLPLLEALENLLQSGSNPAAARAMKQIAPTWYAQVVPLSGDHEETARLINEVRAASQERRKRELGALLQEVSRPRPLVLFLDDLHWADVSTIDVLSFLAGKLEGLGVLIVVTYRPSDLLLLKHPFLKIKPDLQARGACRELVLEFLTQTEIAEYLELEFPDHRFPADFPKLIHEKTEGSPLFMADLVRYLRDRGVIAQHSLKDARGPDSLPAGAPKWELAQALPEIEHELPESVRGMIERKIAQLGEEDLKLLVAAAVQGYEFESAVVAKALGLDAGEVEERLEKLERVYAFVRLVGEREFPEHTLTLRYRFVHVLYQNALYASLRPTRKVTLSREVAGVLEGFYGEQRASVASELAALWEAAREYAKAAEYFHLAAQQASKVLAAQEAAALARRGLRMIEMLPDSRERRLQELSLQVVLGNALTATQGYAAPEVEETYSRAHELGKQLDEPQYLLPTLWGMAGFSLTRARYRKALAYSEEFLSLAERLQGPTLMVAYTHVGSSLYYLGELEQAHDHFQQSASRYRPVEHRPLTWIYGHEPGMIAELYLGLTLWLLGQCDQALVHGRESLRLSREVSHANSRAFASTCVASIYQCCGDLERGAELAEEGAALSAEQGLPHWLGQATVARGWVKVGRGHFAEGIEAIRWGIAAFRFTGAEIHVTYHLSLLAEAYKRAGQPGEGLAVLAEAQALVEKNEERFWEAELYRLKGELLRGTGGAASEVEACFHRAIEIARRQQAKSLELRSAMSLARLWQQQGKLGEAQQMLAGIYGWFTEGFDTADLKQAKSFLDELQQPDDQYRPR